MRCSKKVFVHVEEALAARQASHRHSAAALLIALTSFLWAASSISGFALRRAAPWLRIAAAWFSRHTESRLLLLLKAEHPQHSKVTRRD